MKSPRVAFDCKKFRVVLAEKEMTRLQLAGMINLTQQRIYSITSGADEPTELEFDAIVKCLKIDGSRLKRERCEKCGK